MEQRKKKAFKGENRVYVICFAGKGANEEEKRKLRERERERMR